MRVTINEAHGALLRGLRRLMLADPMLAPLMSADGHLPRVTVQGLASEPWASATFTGHRHRLDLKLRGLAGELERVRERLWRRLRDADIAMRGHVLIELSLASAETRIEQDGEICCLTFEALTIED